ncbi:HTH_17 domain-containing protein [Caenorhabditis elegans]|uniref:HTH_17 domain-containing protein n=1 Tax=Caenorhabditis elegans TaxID=6239 RepID=Q4R151_CAEEL|nr:HTH_17 domain-containing protein [Caenorhabditis elegans]CCD74323.1 HTH_17 domain-containing protein [Caenorhabditis elegans]|eukprot:NP_001033514.1 Uncharacterized protein CELE_Y45G5AM.4 [Caenorhabditis elegans]
MKSLIKTPEYLYSQEFDALFHYLFNQYKHGVFGRFNDHTDFQAFSRMFQKLTKSRNDLEDKFFPEQSVERAADRLKVSKEDVQKGCRASYDKLHKLAEKGRSRPVSWKTRLFGCFRRNVHDRITYEHLD